MTPKILIVVVGPTAVGKTALAVNLAKHFNCDVLSSDSRQFYKEMAIGTAKATIQEMDGVSHHFVDSLSITEEYTVADFEIDALKKLETLFEKNNIQVVAGGSGLFVRTLLEGIDFFPDVDPQIRVQLTQDLEEKGIENLKERVQELDPAYFEEVDQENPQRLLRALEICIGTGKTFSSFRIKKDSKRDFKVLQVGLNTERELLYSRINERVDLMIANGLVKEAEVLHPQRGLVPLKTVGYSEIFDYFEGIHSLERAIDLIKRNSRRYAKRQLTWFKKDKTVAWFKPNSLNKIITYLDNEIQILKTNKMTIEQFIIRLKGSDIDFQETMDIIEENYAFIPTQFTNGNEINKAGENSGSCKLFAFAKEQNLSKEETLKCFGEHFKNVLDNPKGDNHQNIRNFITFGWDRVSFEGPALVKK